MPVGGQLFALIIYMSRAYDVVLWGCTGFTGGLVAEYFASSAPSHVWIFNVYQLLTLVDQMGISRENSFQTRECSLEDFEDKSCLC